MEPNRERIQLLVDALRSREFKQAHGRLEVLGTAGGFCCLGVASVVAMDNGCDIERNVEGTDVRYGADLYKLPIAVMRWYGFNTNDPELLDAEGRPSYAVMLNDSAGYNFIQI